MYYALYLGTEITDILTQLLLAQDDHGTGLSDEELYSQISGFMFAVHEVWIQFAKILCYQTNIVMYYDEISQFFLCEFTKHLFSSNVYAILYARYQ